ncbi:MAG: Crp/Fnr family transcriptional regulator, partial [Candidatus Devosia euplotis]|nr:Crp/Fnr family transcriptional regulator [Candidatus Devosia euplotis]
RERIFRNHLLTRLAPDDIERLGPVEPVDLPLRQTLELADTRIRNIYFIEAGVSSVVAQTAGQREIEVGVIGPEDMSGIALLGADSQSPFETFMQVEDSGYRLPADRLVAALGQSQNLPILLQRYARAFNIQVAATSVSNGNSKLEGRLARWLLMVDDRAGGSFSVTHAFLVTMLAVRQPGVALALQVLEGSGLIRSSRSNATIIDRLGLIDVSNGASGLAEREQHPPVGRSGADA